MYGHHLLTHQRAGKKNFLLNHFLNPFFGVLIAAIFLGESLGIWDAVGVIVIMASIFIVQTSRNIWDKTPRESDWL